jgi:hypothetical protein
LFSFEIYHLEVINSSACCTPALLYKCKFKKNHSLLACGGAFATGTIYGWPAPASQDIVVDGKYAIEVTLTPNQWSWAVVSINTLIINSLFTTFIHN